MCVEVLDDVAPVLSDAKQQRLAAVFLPDLVLGRSIFFRFLIWMTTTFAIPINQYETINFREQPREKPILFYGRHSTHNGDILNMAVITFLTTGRVARMLLHRLLLVCLPALKYVGGVAGERDSAVALLKANFWCGVIPGGADEGLVGHENCCQ